MQIIGLGTDIVEIARLKKVLENNQEHFVSRVFTPAESVLAESKKNSSSCYAGRWAAKEAAAKALVHASFPTAFFSVLPRRTRIFAKRL